MNIDINCDMGEGMPTDAALMPFISSANIACGYHAGNHDIMRKTVELCLRHNVAIGAHPGFDDRKNFGRTSVQLSSSELYDLVTSQLHALNKICKESDAALHHVKPHGAMYNMAAKDPGMSNTLAKAVVDFNPRLIYFGLSGSYMISEAKKVGLKTAHEVFADRTYQPNGSLTPRTNEHALIQDENEMLKQVLLMIKQNRVVATDKSILPIQAETICIHGDGEHALQFAGAIYNQLRQEGVTVQPIKA
ncbi:MAG TPA: 5-oxoprolinase subunit PxpA [Cyclobacteriaceae bacterium]|nr:5-oxoprolinase subunit PxpA [Cyclobacteriaceae bacterium]